MGDYSIMSDDGHSSGYWSEPADDEPLIECPECSELVTGLEDSGVCWECDRRHRADEDRRDEHLEHQWEVKNGR